MITWKLRSEVVEGYIEEEMWVSNEEGMPFRRSGSIALTFGEWQQFNALLLVGEEVMNKLGPRTKVYIEDEDEVVNHFFSTYTHPDKEEDK